MMPFLAPPSVMSNPNVMPEMLSKTLPTIELRGVAFHSITEAQCIAWILSEIDMGRGGWALTVNLDYLRRLVRSVEYAKLCADATLVVADGMPVVWASRIQGTPLPQRVAGSDLISTLSDAAAKVGRSVFLLGGDPGTAQASAEILKARHPSLAIAGIHCPPHGFENDPQECALIKRLLSEAQPDIIYVALGGPKTEKLIAQIRETLPHAWWLGVGISFSFLCGRVRRAPRWVQKVGLEWMHRLVQEPSRLVGRYFRDDLPFALTLMTSAVWNRLRRVLSLQRRSQTAEFR